MAKSPARTVPGSIRMALIGFGSVRPLLIRHDEPWVTCSATQFDSAHQTTTYSLLVKVSRRCCPYDARFRPCRWLLRFRPITSRRCFCRRACVVSKLLATLTLLLMRCRRFCHSVSEKPALRQFRCHLGWAISTKICTSSVSMPYERRCGFSSRRRTSLAFCSCRRPSHRRVWLPSAPTARSRRPNAGEARPRPSRGRSDGRRLGPAMAEVRLFSAGPLGPLHREAK
jgi:hypothetical protein